MKRYIIGMAAGIAVMALAGAHPAAASQCTNTCDQTYTQCDKAGGADCLPKWGQCKRTCAGPIAQSKPTTQTVSTKPKPKP